MCQNEEDICFLFHIGIIGIKYRRYRVNSLWSAAPSILLHFGFTREVPFIRPTKYYIFHGMWLDAFDFLCTHIWHIGPHVLEKDSAHTLMQFSIYQWYNAMTDSSWILRLNEMTGDRLDSIKLSEVKEQSHLKNQRYIYQCTQSW